MSIFDRIVRDPAVMGGKYCIHGTRCTVGMIVAQLKAGYSAEDLVKAYPYLELEDIEQAREWDAEQWPTTWR